MGANLGAILNDLGAAAGLTVEVRSAHGPWFVLAPTVEGTTGAPEASLEAGGAPSFSLKGWFVRWLKPAVYVRSDLGTWTRAPAGEPAATSWPFVPLVVGGVLLLLVVLAGFGVASLLKRK